MFTTDPRVYLLRQKVNIRSMTSGHESDKELADHLAVVPGEWRAITVPVNLPDLPSHCTKPKLGNRLSYYYRFLQHPDRPLGAFEYFVRDTEELDLLGGTPKDLTERYGIEWIVAESEFVRKRRDRSSFAAALANARVAYRNERYTLYDLRG